MTAVQFLRNVIAALPYKIHILLTDNGAHLPTANRTSPHQCTSLTVFARNMTLNTA